MSTSIALLRGINVGGKNLICMPELQAALRDAGHEDVRTYIQSGNVLLSAEPATGAAIEEELEAVLESRFGIPLMVVVRSRDELADIVRSAPERHGAPDLRSDVMFLKDPAERDEVIAALPALDPAIDQADPGPGLMYFSRVAARASSSRLTRIISLPVYQRLTVRNWNTTTKLLALLDET